MYEEYFMLTLPDGRYFERERLEDSDYSKTVLIEITEDQRKSLINKLILAYKLDPVPELIELLEVLTGPER
jgi:hypothetical protein